VGHNFFLFSLNLKTLKSTCHLMDRKRSKAVSMVKISKTGENRNSLLAAVAEILSLLRKVLVHVLSARESEESLSFWPAGWVGMM
jgi:hypothetical protein